MVTWKTKEGISWMESVIFYFLFFIPWGLRVPMWNIDFYSRVLRLSKLPRCKERPKTAICCSTWLGRWKCLGTNLDASVIPFCSWRSCLWNRSTSRLLVSLKYKFLQFVQGMQKLTLAEVQEKWLVISMIAWMPILPRQRYEWKDNVLHRARVH